jgi:transketolase
MDIDQLAINAIRFLSVDQVERAKSGHPGMPLGSAHLIYLIYDRFLKFNPKNPGWINRDRFVLSAGHSSAMLYSVLYLFGYDLSLEELKNFRQLGSKTPGHPESWLTPGVEATTGPLGQGFTNAVGMAIAERYLSAKYNREGYPVIDHYTFVLCSDGDLMEGVSYEAAALAGHLGLKKLIVIWDNNHISIDGDTSLAWSEDVLGRFEALGWEVINIEDGYNLSLIEESIKKATSSDRPSFIAVRTHIGYGSPLQDTPKVHGAPLGEEKVKRTRENLGWMYPPFEVPEEVLKHTRRHIQIGEKREREWRELLESYSKEFPELAEELLSAFKREWSNTWYYKMSRFDQPMATRKASGVVINHIAKDIPNFIGGSADLTESNNTYIKEGGDFSKDNPSGRNIHFGVREHAMGGILNGIAYHGGILPYGGTFLVFSDYMRPTIRLAAMSGLQVVYVFTHDSIGLGEDGPTHQPVEQLSSLRLIPNLTVIRPADANEVRVAWRAALERRDGPTAIILTRQTLPLIDRSIFPSEENLLRGAYILYQSSGDPELIIMASGSEVHPSLEAVKRLEEEGIKVRLVNFPSFELFEEQDDSYKRKVLPADVKRRVAVEAGRGDLWYRYVGSEGLVISLETFGKSAPGKALFEHFGFTGEKIAQRIKERFFS